MFANPSSNRSEGQVWHVIGLFFSPIIAVKMKIGPSSQNLAMVIVALVEHRLLHGLWMQLMLEKGKQVYILSHLQFWRRKFKASHVVLIWKDTEGKAKDWKNEVQTILGRILSFMDLETEYFAEMKSIRLGYLSLTFLSFHWHRTGNDWSSHAVCYQRAAERGKYSRKKCSSLPIWVAACSIGGISVQPRYKFTKDFTVPVEHWFHQKHGKKRTRYGLGPWWKSCYSFDQASWDSVCHIWKPTIENEK